MCFTCIFENDGKKSCKKWLENEFCILPPSLEAKEVAFNLLLPDTAFVSCGSFVGWPEQLKNIVVVQVFL